MKTQRKLQGGSVLVVSEFGSRLQERLPAHHYVLRHRRKENHDVQEGLIVGAEATLQHASSKGQDLLEEHCNKSSQLHSLKHNVVALQ